MFCSTIIPTIGRATLDRAVNSILSQSFSRADFEIIIVNDSNIALPVCDWSTSSRVQIIQTDHRERSVARNAGAAMARGKYLHFLDDDDWLFPDAFDHLWELSLQYQVPWLYGDTQLVDRHGHDLIQLHHGMQGNCFLQAMAGEWIPLQSSLIDSQLFHKLGGFSPLITGPEDIDLFRRICLHGAIAGTPNLIANIERGDDGSTTNYKLHSVMSHAAREDIISTPGVFARMRKGATSAFWCGKLLRVYLTSAVWNLQQRRLFTVFSRLVYGIAAILTSGFHLFSSHFWTAFFKSYQSPTFQYGIKQAQYKQERKFQSHHS
jgi:glycosyltransferase involved in cell wall biosynthesis